MKLFVNKGISTKETFGRSMAFHQFIYIAPIETVYSGLESPWMCNYTD